MRSFLLIACLLIGGCETVGQLEPSEVGRSESPASTIAGKPMAGRSQNESRGDTLAAPEAEKAAVEVVQRQVVYSAALRMVVVSTQDSIAQITRIASEAGGYFQESDAKSITIRVPAGQFESTINRVAGLGEVVERAVKAADVTEQAMDLDIRLDNAKKTRERLLKHLEQSAKLEDTIKLETELQRVSTEIEQLEAKIRSIKSQIAMSTIRVELNATQPQVARGTAGSPFDWIDRLGDGLVAGTVETMPKKPQFLAGGPKFDPPAGFVRYFSSKDLVEAMNADGVRIKVQRHENFDKGPLEFWQKLARKTLVENRALSVASEGALDGDTSWWQVQGTRDVAGQKLTYVLVVTRTNDAVYSVEAWGPSKIVDEQAAALRSSAKSLRR